MSKEAGTEADSVRLCEGKYEFYLVEGEPLRCLRHNSAWRHFLGDKAVTALFEYALELQKRQEAK